jgi:hypothetical protein
LKVNDYSRILPFLAPKTKLFKPKMGKYHGLLVPNYCGNTSNKYIPSNWKIIKDTNKIAIDCLASDGKVEIYLKHLSAEHSENIK